MGICALCAVYAVYFHTHGEKNKKAEKREGIRLYITRVRVREKNAAHAAQSAQSPAQRGFAGRGKSAFLCSCAVVQRLIAFRVSQVLYCLLESKHLWADKVHFRRALRRAGAGREEDIILHLFLRARAVG